MKIKTKYKINPKKTFRKIRTNLASIPAEDWYDYTTKTITVVIGLVVIISTLYALSIW